MADGRVLSACEWCWLDRPERAIPGNAKCESCRVQLVDENNDAARIFQLVRGQKLSNGDLSHLAVWAAIDGYGIKDRVGCFEKCMATFYGLARERQNESGELGS